MSNQGKKNKKVKYLVDAKKDRQRDAPRRICSLCRCELYRNEPYYRLDKQNYCGSCLTEYTRNYFLGQLHLAEEEEQIHDA